MIQQTQKGLSPKLHSGQERQLKKVGAMLSMLAVCTSLMAGCDHKHKHMHGVREASNRLGKRKPTGAGTGMPDVGAGIPGAGAGTNICVA